MALGLSRVLWAKTPQIKQGNKPSPRDNDADLDGPPRWLSVAQHLTDTQVVATWLWDYYLSAATKRLLCRGLGCDEDTARSVYVFAAAIHDVGKVMGSWSWTLINGDTKDPVHAAIIERMAEAGVAGSTPIERAHTWYQHEEWSHAIVTNYLRDLGFDEDTTRRIGLAVVSHHGRVADRVRLRHASKIVDHKSFRGSPWHTAGVELCEHFATVSGLSRCVGQFDGGADRLAVTSVGRFVIKADRIASDTSVFPYEVGGNTSDGPHRYHHARSVLHFGEDHPARVGLDDTVEVYPFEEKFPHAVSSALFD